MNKLLGIALLMSAFSFGLGFFVVLRDMKLGHLKMSLLGTIFFCSLWNVERGISYLIGWEVPEIVVIVQRWLFSAIGIFFGLSCVGILRNGK